MKTLPEVRFVKAWQNYRVGNVIQPPATLRDFLITSGFVEYVDQPTREVVAEVVEPKRARSRRHRDGGDA